MQLRAKNVLIKQMKQKISRLNGTIPDKINKPDDDDWVWFNALPPLSLRPVVLRSTGQHHEPHVSPSTLDVLPPMLLLLQAW